MNTYGTIYNAINNCETSDQCIELENNLKNNVLWQQDDNFYRALIARLYFLTEVESESEKKT